MRLKWGDSSEAMFFRDLGSRHRNWQIPLLSEPQEAFAIVKTEGLNTLPRVPREASNVISYFQGTLTQLLRGLKCEILVDGIFWRGYSPEEVCAILDGTLTRLESIGFFDAKYASYSLPYFRGVGRFSPRARSRMVQDGCKAWRRSIDRKQLKS